MERTLARETKDKIEQSVLLKGWVDSVRDHGKITFIDIRDRSGIVQCVGQSLPKVTPESAIEIEGKVTRRPENLVNKNLETGEVEVQISSLKILSLAEELPVDMGKDELDVSLPTLLDYRTLTLKHPKQQAIFRVQEKVARAFREAAERLGCTEVFTPTIAASATEGGAEVFGVKYYDYNAYLIQSPQLYKQMAVGALERVYLFSHAYRAEPSVTTRHLSEVVQMDCEIAFIENFDELLGYLEFVGVEMVRNAADSSSGELAMYKVEKPRVGKRVPRLTLREAQKILGVGQEPDLSPEDEINICKWAAEKHGSDFVTITHFPTAKRAFYTMPDPSDEEYSLSYDLLFRGLEISSGSQRIHDKEKLVGAIKSRGMDPKDFEMYLQAFSFGMPPEGGFSFGIERVTMKLLGLSNIREASLFPRDMERVDVRLKTVQQGTS